MKPIPKWLSKTKLMRGYRCPKALYLTVHRPELEAPITPETQALFDQGNRVGEKARTYFPGGTLIENPAWDFSGAIAATREAVAAKTPIIYEAAFEYMGCYARADILVYNNTRDRYRLYEVKSSTKLKPEHIDDIGLQTWIMTKSGLSLEQINLMHLNPACRYPDLSNLFTILDITEEMREQYPSVLPTLSALYKSLREPNIPNVDLGEYCLSPNRCGFADYCWKQQHIPDLSVLDLPGLREKKWALCKEGIIALDDPRLVDLTDLQQRIVNAYIQGKRYLNTAGIKEALASWQYPLIFLDFETINPAIPCYDGCGPFMQVPFQFSVHILENATSDLQHFEFLWEDQNDPRPSLIPALLKACGKEGSIVAYYSKFESDRIKELSEFSPSHASALLALLDRMVDPLPILREHVYDNAFAGSFSLKKTAPALLGTSFSYNNMQVANGGDAQRAFIELISPNTPPSKKQLLKEAMLAYCKKDTEVMVDIVKYLYNTASL